MRCQCQHSWKDEALRIDMQMEIRMRLMGHSLRRAIGAQARYGSSKGDLAKAKEWVDQMWVG